MNKQVIIWLGGIFGSGLAHVALLVVLMTSVQPEPTPEQPMPTSELEVQAHQLDRTDAVEQQPDREQTPASTPDGQPVDSGAIARSQAKTALPEPEVLRANTTLPQAAKQLGNPALSAKQANPVAARLSQTKTKITPAAQVKTLIQQATQATTDIAPIDLTAAKPEALVAIPAVIRAEAAVLVAQPAVAISPVSAKPLPVSKAAFPDFAPTPAAKPEPVTVSQAPVNSDDVDPTAPDVVLATPQSADAVGIAAATPDAKKLKAALAFSGGEGNVDPISIAAFQSFMQPGDISASGDQLRDGVSGLLAQVPCSRMQVAFDPDTATLQVNGHIPEEDLRAPVLAALQAQMGANITVSDNILILPRPQCGALSGIAGVGLPQSTDQITNPLVIGDDAHARVFNFAEGELLSLDMTAPDYDAFIYLDYFDAEGLVLHLEPNQHVPLRQANAQAAQQIGAKTMQDAGLKLVISPPFGQEIAVAFAASEPLYEGLRPIQEPAAEYLTWLQDRVEMARANNPDFKGEWVYFFVSTRGQ